VVAKLESANPTGSMKDRVALAMVAGAAADGRLSPGGTVVEYTSGTTGISLAFISAARGWVCFRWERGDAYDVEIVDYH
jgi:cysteine synthase A